MAGPKRRAQWRKQAEESESKKAAIGFPQTAKQKRFCEIFVQVWNVKKAALDAGYSESYAVTHASELRAKLMPYIVELQRAKEQAIAPINQTAVQEEMVVVAFANLDDYVEEYTTIDGKKRIRGRAWSELTRDQKKAIRNVTYDEYGQPQYELHDKKQSIYLLGKYLGMFNDKLIIERRNIDVKAHFNFKDVPTEDLVRLESVLKRASSGVTIDQ